MARARLAKNRAFPPNLYQNSAGYYYFINPQSRKSKGLGHDKAHAFSEARAANAALATIKPTPLADWVLGKSDYTLIDWLPIYNELWLKQGETAPAAATLRSCTMYLRRIAEAGFAWRKLRDVTTAHIAPYLTAVEQGTGAATAMGLRARLSDVFRMAETQGLIEPGRNPVKATYTPSRTVKRERLSLEQYQAIRKEVPAWLARAMDLALVTAQRRDDVAGMKFADACDGMLHVIQGKGQGRVRLALDLNIRLNAVNLSIGEAVAACKDGIRTPYLIHHAKHVASAKPGDRFASNGISTAFTAGRVAAGIEASEGRTPPTFHEIRSLAERLYREQYGPEFAQALLGHKTASMTEKYDDLRGQGWTKVAVR
ncbi:MULTISPECIES: tyrosine-type recombinase/integrase [unclassified Duganella]|uniref:tyrosine-type recombinase/integrase n=1 Tax=unclassified Duganella TaxID=2636909 RepID=UPI00087ED9A6|nr:MULTISPECIES: tyrosine-type recombinase/integrase [unclassified Duganella]SDF79233.1 Bacteriophage lambda integrase, N-terminal domain [Duganella sp. OV458]SDI49898.1 Bacteriophage lambda integrase, N-terminal domain [Duganella sp. OV510]